MFSCVPGSSSWPEPRHGAEEALAASAPHHPLCSWGSPRTDPSLPGDRDQWPTEKGGFAFLVSAGSIFDVEGSCCLRRMEVGTLTLRAVPFLLHVCRRRRAIESYWLEENLKIINSNC